MKDVADLSTDSLAHLSAVKSDGAITQLSVASKTVEKGSLARSYAHTYIVGGAEVYTYTLTYHWVPSVPGSCQV